MGYLIAFAIGVIVTFVLGAIFGKEVETDIDSEARKIANDVKKVI